MNDLALLAIDTSTEYCSVALCVPPAIGGQAAPSVPHAASSNAETDEWLPEVGIIDDAETGCRFYVVEERTGSVSSLKVLPAIQQVLQAAGQSLAACGAIAFGAGPGSFTGLRTATGIVQGLAYGANLPVVPVNTLMACAESARRRRTLGGCEHVLVAMDARMSECYWEAFDWSASAGEWLPHTAARVGAPARITSPWAPETDYAMVGNAASVYGDALIAAASAAHIDSAARPDAAAIAAIGWRAARAGLAYPAVRAQPEYIRDKVALTTQERALERARKLSAAGSSAGSVTRSA